jgi:periplasmic protein TonB
VDGIDGGLAFGGPRRAASGSGDGDAVAIVRVEPQWPREALIQGIEGWVRVEFTIRTDGSVANPRVIESEPGRLFNQSAIRAIQRWRFRPRMVDGRPVERTATQVIEFRLDDH